MNRGDLIAQLGAYAPRNAQEARDRQVLLHLLRGGENIYSRACAPYHMTASAWIVNPARDRALMAYHKIYNSWSWLGGHADGEEDLLSVALREAREESGITRVRPVTGDIYSIEILTVDGHEKRGEYVSSHLHLNVTYLLEADDTQPLRAKPDENSGVAWFAQDEAVAASSEPWFRERIYAKLTRA